MANPIVLANLPIEGGVVTSIGAPDAAKVVITNDAGVIDSSLVSPFTSASVNILKGGTEIGTQPSINLIQGANVTLTVVDNTGSNRIDVTIAASENAGTVTNVVDSSGLFNIATSTSVPTFTLVHSLNGNSGLVQLTNLGKYPALDGSLITNIDAAVTWPLVSTDGKISLGSTVGTRAWINDDGSASLSAGAVQFDTSGNLSTTAIETGADRKSVV